LPNLTIRLKVKIMSSILTI